MSGLLDTSWPAVAAFTGLLIASLAARRRAHVSALPRSGGDEGTTLAGDVVKALFAIPGMAVAVVDREGVVRDANDVFRDEYAQRSLAAVVPWLGDLWSGVDRRLDVEVQIPWCRRQRWSRLQAIAIDAAGGERLAVVVLGMPLSGTGGDLSHDMLAEFVDLTTDWVWQCDGGARYTYASGRIRDFLGYEPAELIGHTACDFMAPADAARAAAVLRSLLTQPRSFARIELLCLHRNGSTVEVEVSGIPIIDADGVFQGYRGVVRDVTEREAHKRALQRLATAIDHAGDVVMITDREARIEYVNPAFELVTGYSSEDAIGQRPNILKSGRQPAEFYDEMWLELCAGRRWAGHFVNKRRDGTFYQGDATISPIFDDDGATTGFVGVQRDVTERLALLGQLHTACEMERFGKLVSGVAHEVRNPLNAIQAATAALELESGNDPDAKPLFRIVRSQVDRLAQLMRDLLVIAKPAHPRLLQRLRAGEVAADALTAWMAAQGEEASSRVSFSVVGDAEVWIDSGRIHEVIVNLLDNAVQHSDADTPIVVTVQQGRDHCTISVRDAGRGIKPEDLDHVFEPFFTTRYGGTGLGLSLVKSIVEQHGGSVALRPNEPPPGCTAEVVLPFAKGTEGGSHAAEAADRRR